ncbi:hypothetical protein DPMN_075880 [Dreissena polymorpha]|uniref:Uncharacterized protein n=1 Tax=Dreissena polymorpha TaxID=45954 RepID=A0A9D3YLC2_DREPO|nr:hypothetical protein DPMN_075880 [Dreissena polymorpha]
MDTTFVGLFILFACTGTVTCLEYCHTGPLEYEYCTYYCCESSSSYYDYCCTTQVVQYWIAAPIVIGVIITIATAVYFFLCFCKTVNGMTRYQVWNANRRVAGTTVTMTTSVNQQSTMNNMPYPPQQPYQGYPMYQQPYPMVQQPYAPLPQSSVPPPYSVNYGQDPSYPPKY